MNIGMMWWIKEGVTLNVGITQAFAYYQKKYGRKPDLCLVNPAMFESNAALIDIDKLTVRPYRPVLPGHIWIGIEEMPTTEKDVAPS